MKTWYGLLTLPETGEMTEATVLAAKDYLSIAYRLEEGQTFRDQWKMQDIRIEFFEEIDSVHISHRFTQGAKLEIRGNNATGFFRQALEEIRRPWYRKRALVSRFKVSLVLIGIPGIIVLSYLAFVPIISEKLASSISPETEIRMGDAAFEALSLSQDRIPELTDLANDFFSAMKIPTSYPIRISVVKSDIVNAFALPGGNIVVYSGLLKNLKHYSELAALLSHEFIHVNNQHATKAISRELGSRIFLNWLFGRLGNVSVVVINQAERFKSLKYSRNLEKEADLAGLSLLAERNIRAEGFTDLLFHLKENAGENRVPEFLASHPDVETRINYLRQASWNHASKESLVLQTIFEKIIDIE